MTEQTTLSEVEQIAKSANRPDLWDRLWQSEGDESWRKAALSHVYDRIAMLTPHGASVVDMGGGLGFLGSRLQDERQARVEVWDNSDFAVDYCRKQGLRAVKTDLTALGDVQVAPGTVFIATEVMEHLSEDVRRRIFEMVKATGKQAFFSVPNNRLGPDEEPQHTVKFTALSFLEELRRTWGTACRVEVLGPSFLLGVCGEAKKFTLTMCMPARDEAADIEAVLASFRGACDEIVVGVDPRTTDDTFDVASRYAEKVFYLTDLDGPEGDKVPSHIPEDKRIHFAHARNQCMDRCTSDWIFMTEGHERLLTGHDQLLSLDVIPPEADVCMVLRSGQGQQWGFPWLCRNKPHLRYTRSTHNMLDYPAGTGCVNLPQVKTYHDRVHKRSKERDEQRKAQNRVTLLDDWLDNANTGSLFYLGSEYRADEPDTAIEYLYKYMEQPTQNGPMRYHCRLVLAKTLALAGRRKEARDVLLGGTGDDWSRIEHWMFLGDLAFEDGKFQEALMMYRYMASRMGDPPFTVWWIDLSCYSYLPAQRLAMCYGELSRYKDALFWAKQVLEQLPPDAPPEVLEETRTNIQLLEEGVTS